MPLLRRVSASLCALLPACTPDLAISTTTDASSTAETTALTTSSTGELVPTTGASAMTTAPESTCSDGILDPGEPCDDDNHRNADGCNNDCRPSGALLWGWRSDLPGSDSLQAVITTAGGDIYAAGYQSANDRLLGLDRWLVRFTGDGEQLWSRSYEEDQSSQIVALTRQGDRLHAAGVHGSDTRSIWTGSFALDGTPGWTDVAASEFGDAYATAITATPDGDLVVAGLRTIDGGLAELWTRRHDPDGLEQWTAVRPIDQKALFSVGPGITTDLDRIFVGFTSHPTTHPLLLVYPATGGAPLLDQPLTMFPGTILALALDPSGDLLAAGYDNQYGAALHRFTAEGEHLWTSLNCLGAAGLALAIDSQGDIAVMGYLKGADLDLHLCKFAGDGTLLWRWTYDGGGNDIGHGVAILPGDRIVVVGDVYHDEDHGFDGVISVLSP